MQKAAASLLRKGFVGVVVLVLTSVSPATVFADAASTDTSASTPSSQTDSNTTPVSSSPASASSEQASSVPASSSPTPTTQTGPTTPPGPSAKTYTYNSDTGLWENQYYTWNPATGQATPKSTPKYSYNPTTGMWDTTQWVYNPGNGTYTPNIIAVVHPPAGAVIAPTSSNASLPSGNQLDTTNTTSSTFDSFYNPNISNQIIGSANSGDALVIGNTTGGNATSGDAQSSANIINLLQSSAALTTGDFTSFIVNVKGDIHGNLLIDPSSLPGGSNAGPATNTQINTADNGQINNNITLAANSGNATVTNNTNAGNATSGDAAAVADVMNLINSVIAAQQSFVGIINIYGNFNGNIVVPQNFLDSLIAGNTNQSAQSDINQTGNLLASFTNNSSISNDVNATASTGAATVAQNTTAGNAITGNAATKVTVFNLTGQKVVASNSLLVFVNVLGQWVGLIMNAPAGTTAAALGGGVANTNTSNSVQNTSVRGASNQAINNNINVAASSGDAIVAKNTAAGNATSGDAFASANILNMTNSDFSISNWFGILFINVFGNWFGDFGVQLPDASANNSSGATPSSVDPDTAAKKVLSFIPTMPVGSLSPVDSLLATGNSQSDNPEGQQSTSPDQHLVSLLTHTSPGTTHFQSSASTSTIPSRLNIVLLGVGTVGVIVLGTEQVKRFVRLRTTRRT